MPKSALIILGIIVILGGIYAVASQRSSTPATPPTPLTTATSTSAPLDTTTDNNAATVPSQSSSPTTNATTDSTSPTNKTVTYNADGTFSPISITVTKGSTVTFVNNSARPMWVASDPHPQHTNLNGFDARKNYSQGQSYTYTFNETGTFTYHNHSVPSSTGTVIVQ